MNGLFKLLPNENALFRNHGQILMDIYKHNPEARSTQAAGVSQVPAINTALVTEAEALRYPQGCCPPSSPPTAPSITAAQSECGLGRNEMQASALCCLLALPINIRNAWKKKKRSGITEEF